MAKITLGRPDDQELERREAFMYGQDVPRHPDEIVTIPLPSGRSRTALHGSFEVGPKQQQQPQQETDMNINDAFPSNYIKASDLPPNGQILTIANVTMEDLDTGDGGKERKAVVHFSGTQKGLVLNRTNAGTISDLLGGDTDAWTGKQIILFSTHTDFRGKTVQCIRVKPELPQAAAPAAPAAEPVVKPIQDSDIPF